ncbi:hypothetical protein [Shewanella sp. MEBiC00475]|uniref:hypothetical protein n=1 Tax=Shewanella sp. MEBiC00475 TaxID=2575361 RepID=UPI0010C06EE8|nr:hypothetical protein [Shewanella sp. MEBiC00475]
MNFSKKAVVGVILALIVGGLGNGIWKYVFEPVFAWSISATLNVATLGVEAFKDDLYNEIAKGFHEASSLTLANDIYYWVGVAVAFAFFLFTRKTKDLVSNVTSIDKELDDIEEAIDSEDNSSNEPEESIHERISRLRANNSVTATKASILNKTAYACFAVGVAFYAWMTISSVKATYINSAITHYEQSLSIIAPLATDKELVIMRSRFSQIKSKDDYENIVFDIAQIGKRENIELKEFTVW